KNNSDPLHVSLGNSDLKPSFSQSFRLDFRRFKSLSLNATINLSTANNSISTKTLIDSLGRQISQPVNVEGNKTAGVAMSGFKTVEGWNIGVQTGATYSQSANYVNADINRNNTYTATGGFSLNKYRANKYSMQLAVNFAYFNATSTINLTAPVRYWSQSHSGTVTIFILKGFEIGTNANYTWQERSSAFAKSTSVLYWNAFINRDFIHNRLVVSARLNNILDENSGIARTNAGNIYTESYSNVLGRYYMVLLTYHFDGKLASKQ
ncbi:MAG: outer membrane beta-barrel protein, partial [Bacteroidetes bacterium]|nr:outer membrane beta-barrel protein [Bacteroidota bacterium]